MNLCIIREYISNNFLVSENQFRPDALISNIWQHCLSSPLKHVYVKQEL